MEAILEVLRSGAGEKGDLFSGGCGVLVIYFRESREQSRSGGFGDHKQKVLLGR